MNDVAGTAEIKSRIKSIAETKKVTDAMYMISSVKMRKAKAELESTRPYFKALRQEIGTLLHHIPENNDRYFRINDPDGIQGRALLLITSDKGLNGNYNQMAIKTAQERVLRHPDSVMFIIGEYGRQYFKNRKIISDDLERPAVNEAGKVLLRQQEETVRDFNYAMSFPTIWEARRICAELLDYYDNDRVDEIDIIYTHYKAGKTCECRTNCLLPLDRAAFYAQDEDELSPEKQYYPDPDSLLDGIVPSYLTGFIYSALVDSYCSEQEARMTAMSSAGRNAEEMLKKLRIQYNSIRQAAITREMTEIAAGAKALKRKREMRKD